jgi:hypothetical protein
MNAFSYNNLLASVVKSRASSSPTIETRGCDKTKTPTLPLRILWVFSNAPSPPRDFFPRQISKTTTTACHRPPSRRELIFHMISPKMVIVLSFDTRSPRVLIMELENAIALGYRGVRSFSRNLSQHRSKQINTSQRLDFVAQVSHKVKTTPAIKRAK